MKRPHELSGIAYLILVTVFLLPGCSDHQQRALKIHKAVLTIDTHTDTPLRLGSPNFDIGLRNDPYENGSKVDFPRMKEGGLDAVFFAVFVGQGERTAEGNRRARERADRLLEDIRREVSSNSHQAELAFAPEDARRIEKTGKRAVYLGMENAYPLGNDLSLIAGYYRRGIRYITLCHSANNDICDSSTDPEGPEHDGLSDFGREVVKEMNRTGMLVDVSHISDKAFYDVLEISSAPVFASHSCARALCDHPRNLDDDMIRALAAMGGVIQVCFVPSYLKTPEPDPLRDSVMLAFRVRYPNLRELSEEEMEEARQRWFAMERDYPPRLPAVSDLIDHIDHIVQLVGIDHVGIGTDFDGGGALSDCYDVSRMENITAGLLDRGYSRREIKKIWGGNFLRVFQAATDMSETGP